MVSDYLWLLSKKEAGSFEWYQKPGPHCLKIRIGQSYHQLHTCYVRTKRSTDVAAETEGGSR